MSNSDSKSPTKPKTPYNRRANLPPGPGPGRPKGSPNKKLLVWDTLQSKGFNPVVELLALYPELSKSDKLDALRILIQYSAARPSDIDEHQGQSIVINYTLAEKK